MILHITIPGLPVAKERPRLGKHGVYTPKGTRAWEDSVAWLARGQVRAPFVGPVSLGVWAIHPRPVNRPAYVPLALWRLGNRQYAVTTKDLDNIVKCCADALNGLGVWHDDNQVAHIEARSWYAAVGEAPCVELTVEAL